MLFDLRSRGRRRTVRVVYFGLALIMLGGLLLVGVGTGSGGGILNAFTNNGSGANQNQVVGQQEKTALKETRQRPSDPTAWADLVQARWTAAGQAGNYNASTGAFTAAGNQELHNLQQDWQRYLTLTRHPSSDVAIVAARAYAALSDYSGESSAYEVVTQADPSGLKGYECLAVSAYAAKQNRKGDLAQAKALSLVPKLQRPTLKAQIQAAKSQPQIAQSC